MLPQYKQQQSRCSGLTCAAYTIIFLLSINTLLLGTLVAGCAVFAYKAQPILSAVGPDDVRRLTSAIRAVDETDLMSNVGTIMQTVSDIHLLPENVIHTAYGVLGLDVGFFAKNVVDITGPALSSLQTIEFSTEGEADIYASTANILNVATSVANLLTPWKRVNDSPNPDLGILDTILGSGSAGSGASWVYSQLNATALKQVSAACMLMHNELDQVNLPAVSWKPFMVSNASPSGKYKLAVDTSAPTSTLVTPNVWSDVVNGVSHVCSGINEFVTRRDAMLQQVEAGKKQ